ncbi:WD40 repeat domain-containing serine/threonine protein kinase [Nonomuraea endophytica]|uniref:WD40 repeat domain-containing serine/threonine protein kinase n=1 Tax=Nonomuraea endophytica TaxID=714136 RepID=UPI0037CB1498
MNGVLVAGRYRLVEEIGAGGMGRVWRGQDELMGRTVAVKEIRLPTADQQIYERVVHAIKSAAQLHHPCIVTVHDIVSTDEGPMIVMEYFAGRSLAQVIATDGPLPVAHVRGIAVDVLNILVEAHQAGIIHRDLRPSNILLSGARLVVTDFGVSRPSEEHSPTPLSTAAFLPPEQVRGEDPGPAGDLWSLGATLHAALEGRSPFEGPTLVATLAAVLAADRPRPERAGPLTPLLDALLQRDPARRPTATQALALLAAAPPTPPLAGPPPALPAGPSMAMRPAPPTVPHTASPAAPYAASPAGPNAPHLMSPGAPPTGPALLRRRSLLYGGAAATLLAGIGATAAFLLQDDAPKRPPQAKPSPPQKTGTPSPATTALKWTALHTFTGHDKQTPGEAVFTPDGGSVIISRYRGGGMLASWDVRTGKRLRIFGDADLGTDSLSLKPDGTRVVTSGVNRTSLWNPATGAMVEKLGGHSTFWAAKFSPDGSMLVTTGGGEPVLLWTPEGKLLAKLKGHTGIVWNPAFSSDSTLLITPSEDRTARLWDVREHKLLHTLKGHLDIVTDASISPDGKLAATSSRDGTARLWDTGTGEQLAELEGEVYNIAFRPTAPALLATTDITGPFRYWNPASPGQPTELPNQGRLNALTFSADGSLLATCAENGEIYLWDGTTGVAAATLTGHTGAVRFAAFNHDGTALASCAEDGTARVWQLSR